MRDRIDELLDRARDSVRSAANSNLVRQRTIPEMELTEALQLQQLEWEASR